MLSLDLKVEGWLVSVERSTMKRAKSKGTSLTLLGRSETKLPAAPSEARLETFLNPTRRNYHIHFETDDFTCLCPVTGQPDFARIDIDYVPDRLCVESKSLKFYLASYRSERAFNEAVTNRILDDFVKACSPRDAVVTAQFSARGGIALTVRAEYPDKSIGRDGR
jgi:7-cyano-7-deazaguanine reductase